MTREVQQTDHSITLNPIDSTKRALLKITTATHQQNDCAHDRKTQEKELSVTPRINPNKCFQMSHLLRNRFLLMKARNELRVRAPTGSYHFLVRELLPIRTTVQEKELSYKIVQIASRTHPVLLHSSAVFPLKHSITLTIPSAAQLIHFPICEQCFSSLLLNPSNLFKQASTQRKQKEKE